MSEGESRTLPLDRSDYSLSPSWANYFHSFDRWGVELGKVLAHDSSTNNLLRRYRKLKQTP
jgi:hypothetical protein